MQRLILGYRALGLAVLALLVTACANHGELFARIDDQLADHRVDQALTELEASAASGRDRVLYLLNKGMLLRRQGDLQGSIAALEDAKALIGVQEPISISAEAIALTWTEGGRAYQPRVFERLLLHIYQALNYLELGDLDAARVEAFQIDVDLRRLEPKTGLSSQGGDAFARYLSGLIFEARGEWSDAMIAYRKAVEAYDGAGMGVPPGLSDSLVRLADHLDLIDERDSYQARFGIEHWEPIMGGNGSGELIVVLHNGLAPLKYSADLPIFDPRTGQLYKLSLPQLQMRTARVASFRVQTGELQAAGERVEILADSAQRALDAEMPGLILRSIARNTVKRRMTKKAGRENDLLGVVVNIAGFIAEQADIRSWRTLPDNIQLARAPLPSGMYDVEVVLLDGAGNDVGRRTYPHTAIRAGAKTFLSLHWVTR